MRKQAAPGRHRHGLVRRTQGHGAWIVSRPAARLFTCDPVVQGVAEVRTLIGQPPVVVGGLAVMCRLSSPYRATTDPDVVDRLLGEFPRLQLLRAARGAQPVEPASVLLPTPHARPRREGKKRSKSLPKS